MWGMGSGTDMLIQLAVLTLTLTLFYIITHTFPHKTLTKLRTKSRASTQANTHFISGAKLLSRAQITRNKSTSLSLAEKALWEAEKAILLNPKDPASNILKALSLSLLGRRPAALKSLDLALSSRDLSGRERGNALVKRAEIYLAMNKKRRVDNAVDDLLESLKLGSEGAKVYCLLGECYQMKGMVDKAKEAFEEAIRVEPGSVVALKGLQRVGTMDN